MLIDAGRKSSRRALEPLMERLEITELDYIVATHYDQDHIGGFTTPTGASILWSDRNCTTRSFFPTIAVIDPGPSQGETASERQWARCIGRLFRQGEKQITGSEWAATAVRLLPNAALG